MDLWGSWLLKLVVLLGPVEGGSVPFRHIRTEMETAVPAPPRQPPALAWTPRVPWTRGGRQNPPWGRLGPKNGHCSYQTSSNRGRKIVNFGALRSTPAGLSRGLPLVSGGDEAPLGVWGVAHTPWGRAFDRPDAKWMPNTH